MSDNKRANMFSKLAALETKTVQADAEPVEEPVVEEAPPSPAPPVATPRKPAPAKKAAVTTEGKKRHPDYCQANAYIPKTLRKAVNRALIDIDGLDYGPARH